MAWVRDPVAQEKRTVERMIRLYCRKHHRPAANLCPDCVRLREYAHARLDRCPFGIQKSSCELCTVHCYQVEMRETMKKVMRYSGPRMILAHPADAIRHLIRNRLHKMKSA